MFSVKAFFSKVAPASQGGEALPASIPRDFRSHHRSELRPTPPVQPAAATDTRGAERFVPRRTSTVLATGSGQQLKARIINVSSMGIAVEADFSQIPLETIVMAGSRRVIHGRAIVRGVVFLFDVPLPLRLCNPELVV